MPTDWWIPIVKWCFWILVMAPVMVWVARSRHYTRPHEHSRELRHPVVTLVIGLLGAVFFFGIAIFFNTIGKNPTATLWTTLCFVLFGVMSLALVADYFFARHYLSDIHINYGRMLGQRGSLAWSDVEFVRYAPVLKWFELRATSGCPVRVSAMLMGLPEFARLVLEHVRKDCIDVETRRILEQTRAGQLPSIWG